MRQSSSDNFERQLRQALDRRAEGLDAATLSRLRQARERALARWHDTGRWRLLGRWLAIWNGAPGVAPWAAGLAGVTALVVGLAIWHGTGDQGWPMIGDDLEVLASNEDLMLYQDLDFYLWLEQEAGLIREHEAGNST